MERKQIQEEAIDRKDQPAIRIWGDRESITTLRVTNRRESAEEWSALR